MGRELAVGLQAWTSVATASAPLATPARLARHTARRLDLTTRVARWKTTALQARFATGKPRPAVITCMRKWINVQSSPIRGKRCTQRGSLTKPSTKNQLYLLLQCGIYVAPCDVRGSGRSVAPQALLGRGRSLDQGLYSKVRVG